MANSEPPYLDEHSTVIDADADTVWSALLRVLDGTSSRASAAYARLVGCDDDAATGPRPLDRGSTLPGFHVVAAVPGSELALAGRHRFSTYALIFRIEELTPGRSRLTAESRAEFPGVTGGAYRLLVVGTRGHVFAVRRLLSHIRSESKRRQ